VDLGAIARAQRRRQALDALEFERNRETALRDQLEEVAAELEGPGIDEQAFALVAPEDVALVREVWSDAADADLELAESWWAGAEAEADEDTSPESERAERLAEVQRLRTDIDASRRRQQAFDRYLAALEAAQHSDREEGMAKLSDDVKQVLQGPNFWHLATLNPDGSPQVTPVWADLRDDRILVNSYFGRKKPRNIQHDPRVALAWQDPESPYHNIAIQGRVVDTIVGDQAVEDIDALSEKYLGQRPYPGHSPDQPRVSFLIEPEHVSVYGD
jgi:PPOX class probable F420-dependent enzyme